ncbi:MAG: hypothetical protein ACFFCQ_03760 [Promethearchaeota archaeon]
MEKYPYRVICLSLTFTLAGYMLGSVIFYLINPVLGILYLILCATTILIALKLRCTYCYYYGKWCSFGFGKISKLLFKKGDPKEFRNSRNVTITAIFSFGTLLLPFLGGLILLITDFSILNLSVLVAYALIGVVPNFFIRGRVCENCEQGKLGCPTYEQMMKRKKEK